MNSKPHPVFSEVQNFGPYLPGGIEFAFKVVRSSFGGIFSVTPLRDLNNEHHPVVSMFNRLKNADGSVDIELEEDAEAPAAGTYIATLSTNPDDPTQLMFSGALPLSKYGIKSYSRQALDNTWILNRLGDETERNQIISGLYQAFGELSLPAITDTPSVVKARLNLSDSQMAVLQEGAEKIRANWNLTRVLMLNGFEYARAEDYIDFSGGASATGLFDEKAYQYIQGRRLPANLEYGLLCSVGVVDEAISHPQKILPKYLAARMAKDGHSAESIEKCLQYIANGLNLHENYAREVLMTLISSGVADSRKLRGEDTVSFGRSLELDRVIAEAVAERHGDMMNDMVGQVLIDTVIMDGETKTLGIEQRAALHLALTSRTCIITGGPGRGKTTTIKAVVENLKRINPKGRILMTAPTGMAAKRMEDVTGVKCYTMHRLMGMSPNSSSLMNRFGPEDTLIVDEFSLVDLTLFANALRHTGCRGRVIFVGDKDQLKSIESGSILHELMLSRFVQVAELTEPHRFAQNSGIIQAADKIKVGQVPRWEELPGDVRFIEAETPEEVATFVQAIVDKELKSGKYRPDRIQVLGGVRKGLAGITALNKALKRIFNPNTNPREGAWCGRTQYHVGDRIMYLSNRYELDLQNGDVGQILSIDHETRRFTAQFDKRVVTLSFDSYHDFEHSWAGTVHKSQGSEYDVVILALPRDHEQWLTRQHIYTGLTRAKRVAYVVGSKKTLTKTIKNPREHVRKTHLSFFVAQQVAVKIKSKMFQVLGLNGKNPSPTSKWDNAKEASNALNMS